MSFSHGSKSTCFFLYESCTKFYFYPIKLSSHIEFVALQIDPRRKVIAFYEINTEQSENQIKIVWFSFLRVSLWLLVVSVCARLTDRFHSMEPILMQNTRYMSNETQHQSFIAYARWWCYSIDFRLFDIATQNTAASLVVVTI